MLKKKLDFLTSFSCTSKSLPCNYSKFPPIFFSCTIFHKSAFNRISSLLLSHAIWSFPPTLYLSKLLYLKGYYHFYKHLKIQNYYPFLTRKRFFVCLLERLNHCFKYSWYDRYIPWYIIFWIHPRQYVKKRGLYRFVPYRQVFSISPDI